MSQSKLITIIPPALLGLITGALYFSTLARSIYLEDSAEFVTASATLSVPHPSGYPLYILTTKLISLVPFLPTIVERVNFVSLFWTLAAVMLLYFTLLKIYKNKILSWGLSFIFAVSPMVWQQATYAEVYSLTSFFFVILIWLYLRYHEQPTNKRLYLLIFAYGLSLTNHFLPLALAPLIIWVSLRALTTRHPERSPAKRDEVEGYNNLDARSLDSPAPNAGSLGMTAIKLLFFFLLGLLPYLYIPIRAAMDPPFAWFGGDVSKLLMYNIAYGYKITSHTWRYVHDVLKSFLESYGWVGWSLSFAGFVALFWKKHFLRWPAALSFLLLSIGLMTVLSGGQAYTLFASSFYKTLHVPALLMSLIPLGFLLQIIYKSKFRFFLFYPLLLMLLSFPAFDLGNRFLANDRSDYVFLENYSRRLLESLPQDANLFIHQDQVVNDPIIFSLAYQRYLKKLRPDLKIFSLSPVFLPPTDFPVEEIENYDFQKIKLVEKYLSGRKDNTPGLFSTMPVAAGVGNGFVYQISKDKNPSPDIFYAPDNLELPAVSGNLFARMLVAKYYYDLSARLYSQGKLKQGQWFLVQAIGYDPDEFSEYYYRITALRDSYFKH